jgi:hypothetical protein
VVNRRKPRVQTPVVSRYPTPAPVHDFVLLFLPQCGLHLIPFDHQVHQAEPTCLSTLRRPHKAKTFCACFSPAPTQIKPQHAPAILGQESVHTTLSITLHTMERPSTGPRMLQSSIISTSSPTKKLTSLLYSSLVIQQAALLSSLGAWTSGIKR